MTNLTAKQKKYLLGDIQFTKSQIKNSEMSYKKRYKEVLKYKKELRELKKKLK